MGTPIWSQTETGAAQDLNIDDSASHYLQDSILTVMGNSQEVQESMTLTEENLQFS